MVGLGETLGRILTLMLSLLTRLRKAEIHTLVSEERKLYHNPSMSPIPQKLIANYSIPGQPIAFDIYSGAPRIWQRGGAQSRMWERSPQPPPTNFCGFDIKNTHFSTPLYRKRACSECSHHKQCKNIIAAYAEKQKLG